MASPLVSSKVESAISQGLYSAYVINHLYRLLAALCQRGGAVYQDTSYPYSMGPLNVSTLTYSPNLMPLNPPAMRTKSEYKHVCRRRSTTKFTSWTQPQMCGINVARACIENDPVEQNLTILQLCSTFCLGCTCCSLRTCSAKRVRDVLLPGRFGWCATIWTVRHRQHLHCISRVAEIITSISFNIFV